MYLPLLQDFCIAVGQSHHYARYPHENSDAQLPSTSCNQDLSSSIDSENRENSTPTSQSVLVDVWCLPESQSEPQPVSHVPSIRITPPDTIPTEPANHATCETRETEDQGSKDDQYKPRSCDSKTPHTDTAPDHEALMDQFEQLPTAPYEHLHYAESITKDYDEWLRLAQGAAENPCEDGVASGGKAGSSIESTDVCNELVLWKPTPIATKSRDYERRFSIGRRFSLNQSVVYPFRAKRNSV